MHSLSTRTGSNCPYLRYCCLGPRGLRLGPRRPRLGRPRLVEFEFPGATSARRGRLAAPHRRACPRRGGPNPPTAGRSSGRRQRRAPGDARAGAVVGRPAGDAHARPAFVGNPPPASFSRSHRRGTEPPAPAAALPADRLDAPDRGAVVLTATASEDLGRLLDLSARAPTGTTGPPGGAGAGIHGTRPDGGDRVSRPLRGDSTDALPPLGLEGYLFALSATDGAVAWQACSGPALGTEPDTRAPACCYRRAGRRRRRRDRLLRRARRGRARHRRRVGRGVLDRVDG
jgi:hypothetical protein